MMFSDSEEARKIKATTYSVNEDENKLLTRVELIKRRVAKQPEEELILPSHKLAEGQACRGIRKCHYCHTMWDRDKNAARNIGLIFTYLFHGDGRHRPIVFQRMK